MRATNLAIGLIILVASATFVTTALGPVFGFDMVTGQQENIEQTNDNVTSSDASLSENGEASPLSALDQVSKILRNLGNADRILVNLGVPVIVANWITSPLAVAMALALVAVVVRFRL
ncbi:hypothetical protein [Haloarchaeobius sp. DFWS5]|uniref:hypothetical protein n=1 Tax=Haloarchaeobius sp. DFWS5 TaxID=3446114 RepID=UPI003EBDDC80